MGSNTTEAARMREIVADNAPMLKDAGFKKRRHCFNRHVGDGLVHVVYFWHAPKEPPAWTEVPGLRERLYGKFRLDFGVHVPEMDRFHSPRGPWINDYDCDLRRTTGQLFAGYGASDLWWSLEDDQAPTLAAACLRDQGLPWLDDYPDAAAILDAFDELGPLRLGMSPAGGLDIADLCRARGETLRERRVLEDYVAHPILVSHRPTLVTYLERHDHGDLIARIATRGPVA